MDSYPTDGALAAAPAPKSQSQQWPGSSPQGSLFGEKPASRVIPFESFAASRIEPLPKAAARPQPRQHPPAVKAKKTDAQPSLDFLPPAPLTPRTLRTTVETVIYCDAPVAATMHRVVAAALDFSMVLIAFGLFILTYYFSGGEFVLNRTTMIAFGSTLVLIWLFYGLLWVLAKSETAGMRWAQLRVTNFDGYPPDRIQRALRFAGTCLSVSTLGLGLLWVLMDEESLAWQDHISKTFPTPREPNTHVVRS